MSLVLDELRFNVPRFSPAGEERIRLAMQRGHPGDDPGLPIRQASSRREGNSYISWHGPVDYGKPEEALWEMEIDVAQFLRKQDRSDSPPTGAYHVELN